MGVWALWLAWNPSMAAAQDRPWRQEQIFLDYRTDLEAHQRQLEDLRKAASESDWAHEEYEQARRAFDGILGGGHSPLEREQRAQQACEALAAVRRRIEALEVMRQPMERRAVRAIEQIRTATALEPPDSFPYLDGAGEVLATMRADLDSARLHPTELMILLARIETLVRRGKPLGSADLKSLQSHRNEMLAAANVVKRQAENVIGLDAGIRSKLADLRDQRARALAMTEKIEARFREKLEGEIKVRELQNLQELQSFLKQPIAAAEPHVRDRMKMRLDRFENTYVKPLDEREARLFEEQRSMSGEEGRERQAREFLRQLSCQISDIASLMERAHKSTRDLSLSLDAAEALYRVKSAKVEQQLREARELAERYRESLREIRGKQNYIKPLIAEREGRSDSKAREQLATLLEERARLERLEREVVSDAELLVEALEQIADEQARVERGERELEASTEIAAELVAEGARLEVRGQEVQQGLIGMEMGVAQ